jgi:hypothetical protein
MAKKLIIEAAIHELTPKSNNPTFPMGRTRSRRTSPPA